MKKIKRKLSSSSHIMRNINHVFLTFLFVIISYNIRTNKPYNSSIHTLSAKLPYMYLYIVYPRLINHPGHHQEMCECIEGNTAYCHQLDIKSNPRLKYTRKIQPHFLLQLCFPLELFTLDEKEINPCSAVFLLNTLAGCFPDILSAIQWI